MSGEHDAQDQVEELVAYVASQLVTKPDEVGVTRADSGDSGDRYELTVGDGDLGHVIGRQGRTARAIRAVARAAAAREGRRVHVEIVE